MNRAPGVTTEKLNGSNATMVFC